VDELRGLLSDEQCDDLLAALGRPAVVKLAASPNITSLIEQVRLADPQAGRPVVTLRSLGPVPEP
jgi:hypothetical protein